MNKQVDKKSVNASEAEAKKASVACELLSAKSLGLEAANSDVQQEYALWVRVLLQNWRQGTLGCKARGEVSYTNKKPWKQKGTGRARAGSARSPLWRGGGVTFGPQARVKTLKINKKNKKHVLSALMLNYAEQNMVNALDWNLSQDKPSTALASQAFNAAGFSDKKVTLFLHRDDVSHWMSVRNLNNVQVLAFDDVNAYELSLGHCVVVLKKDLDSFKDMVKKWN